MFTMHCIAKNSARVKQYIHGTAYSETNEDVIWKDFLPKNIYFNFLRKFYSFFFLLFFFFFFFFLFFFFLGGGKNHATKGYFPFGVLTLSNSPTIDDFLVI